MLLQTIAKERYDHARTLRYVLALALAAVLVSSWIAYVCGRSASSLAAYERGRSDAIHEMRSEDPRQSEAEAYLEGLHDGINRR